MKTLGIITLFLVALTLALSVGILYILNIHITGDQHIIDSVLEQKSQTFPDRYELIFEQVLHESLHPSKDNPGLVTIQTDNRLVCLKFDKLTGKVWQYVDSFYYDPNILRSAHGFVELKEDYQMYQTTSRKPELASQGLPELPEGFVLVDPNVPSKSTDWKSDLASLKKRIEAEKSKNRLKDFDLRPVHPNDPNQSGKIITSQELFSEPNKPTYEEIIK